MAWKTMNYSVIIILIKCLVASLLFVSKPKITTDVTNPTIPNFAAKLATTEALDSESPFNCFLIVLSNL